jgi:hypothetical protein
MTTAVFEKASDEVDREALDQRPHRVQTVYPDAGSARRARERRGAQINRAMPWRQAAAAGMHRYPGTNPTRVRLLWILRR